MEMKDQRIELRLPLQQLEELDNFIDEIDTQFKPTRSDVLRSFIAQGVRGKFSPDSQDVELFSLPARLNIFFQLCQLQRIDCLGTNSTPPVVGNQFVPGPYLNSAQVVNTVTHEALIRQVYLQRLTWFFELDEQSLKSIHFSLGQPQLLSLMGPKPDRKVCDTLADVNTMRSMFERIGVVLQQANKRVEEYLDNHVRENLARIHGYAKDNSLPLTFKGYPETADWAVHTEMWAMRDWIERGNGYLPINDSDARGKEDLSVLYATMLQVYGDISSRQNFDLNALEQMVKDRRFYQL